jgi:O-antigen biosynthesis protein
MLRRLVDRLGLRQPLRRLSVVFIERLFRYASRLMVVARQEGLNLGAVWSPALRGPFRARGPAPLSLRDVLWLAEAPPAGGPAVPPALPDPECSIIIPVFNQAEHTFQCLRALLGEIDPRRHEVLVVDNASSDETPRLLQRFADRVRVLRNAENRGFVDACNQAARAAAGRYLVFLNNDTLVQPGWLPHLVETAEADPAVGAVGSMLLYPDGRLQEAGALVWNDGQAHNYGRYESPEDPRFTFAREVDYCSGASLLVRRELFERLGGFDARYAPAYYEDADLGMGLRSLGQRVVYQPLSRVVHHEGATAGSSVEAGFKRHQAVNRHRFAEKWRGELARGHLAPDGSALRRASNRKPGLRILVGDEAVPEPDRDAGGARMAAILATLNREGLVVFAPFAVYNEGPYADALYRAGIEILPPARLARRLREERFDLALLSRPRVAQEMLGRLRRHSPQTRVVFDTVDLHFLRLQREAELGGNPALAAEAARYRKMEARLARRCDQVWCVSEQEAAAIRALAPQARTAIVPTIHAPAPRSAGYQERQGLLFVGNFRHRPNADAMLFFAGQIRPLLQELLPGVALSVVGSDAPPEVQDLNSPPIQIHGFVPDLDPLLQGRRVFVCPLRFGAGMKGKVGQALAAGLPVVTTSIGAEGIGLVDGEHALIADDPRGFAARVAEVYRDEALWRRLSENGRRLVAERFSPAVAAQGILDAMASLGVRPWSRTPGPG